MSSIHESQPTNAEKDWFMAEQKKRLTTYSILMLMKNINTVQDGGRRLHALIPDAIVLRPLLFVLMENGLTYATKSLCKIFLITNLAEITVFA